MTGLRIKRLAFMSIANTIKGFLRKISGVSNVVLNDCVDDASLIDYKIYGNSVQNPEPTPETPVDVESVGEYDEETGKYKIPVKCCSKNLLGDYIYTDQTTRFHPVISTSKTYTLKPGVVYTISFYASSTYKNVYFHHHAKTVEGFKTMKLDGTRKSVTVTPTEYITTRNLISIYDNISDGNGSGLCSNCMVEEGEVATDYEPYREPVTTNIYLDEPLRKIGNIADYIDFEKRMVVRKIGKWMFKNYYTGGSGIDYYSRNSPLTDWKTCCVALPFENMAKGYTNKLANCFKRVDNNSAFSASMATHGIFSGHPDLGSIYIDIGDNKSLYNQENPIRNWEHWNEAYVIGELATATETPIVLPKLPTIKGTTIYLADTQVQPSNMELSYYSTSKE